MVSNKSNLCLFILVLLFACISCETKNVTAKQTRNNDFGNYFRNARFGSVTRNENVESKIQPYLAKRKARLQALQNANPEQKTPTQPNKRYGINPSECSAKFYLESFFALSGEPTQLTSAVKANPKIAKGRFLGIGNKFVPRKDGVIKALRYYPTPKNQNQNQGFSGLINSFSAIVYDESGRIFSAGQYEDVNQEGWIYAPLIEAVAVRAGQTWYPTTTIRAGDEYYQKEHESLDNQKSLTAPKGVSVRYDRVDSFRTNDNQNFLDVLFTPHNTFFHEFANPTDVAPLRFLQTNFQYVNTFKPKVNGKIYGIRYYHMPGDITPQHIAHFASTEDQFLTLISQVLSGYKFDESSNEPGWRTYYLPYGVSVNENEKFSVSVNFRVETLDGVVPGINFAVPQTPTNDFLEFVESGFGLFGLKFVERKKTAYLIDVLFNPEATCLGENIENSFGINLIGGLASSMIPQFGNFENVIEALGGDMSIDLPMKKNSARFQGYPVLGIPDTTPNDFSSCRNDRTIETLFGYDNINSYSRGKSERKVTERTAAQSIQIGNTFLPKRSGVIKAFKFYRPDGDSSHVPNVRDRFFSFYFHTLKVGVPVALITGETSQGWQYLPASVVVEKGFLLDFTYDVYKKSKYLEIKNHESKKSRNSLSLPAGVQGDRTFIQLVEDILDHPLEFVGDLVGGGALTGSSFTEYLYNFYPNNTREKTRFPLDALFVPFQGVFDFDEEERTRGYRRPQIKFDNSRNNVESGNVVTFSENGFVYGVTFHKKQNDGTQRVVKIWEFEENDLKKANKRYVRPISSEEVYYESQTGWQESNYFSEPVPVKAGVKYVISVNYDTNVAYIDQQLPIVNGFVTLHSSVVGESGDYPSGSTRGVNLVDVLFLVNNDCLGEECVAKKST